MIRHAASLLFAAPLLLSSTPAWASSHICIVGGTCYSSIQNAVDAATDGDVITLAAGTYIGQVAIDNLSVTLRGAGAASTTLHANNHDTVLTVTNATVVIEDVEILARNHGGQGISATSSALTARGVVFGDYGTSTSFNTAGTAVRVNGGSLHLDGSRIDDVHCTGHALAVPILLENGASATIVNSTFEGNRGRRGSVMHVATTGNVTINGSTFTDNTVSGGGGTIFNSADHAADIVVLNSAFIDNTATGSVSGAAVYVVGGSLAIDNSDFLGNTSGGQGGAVLVWSADLYLDGSVFDDNQTPHGNGGGGLAALGNTTAIIHDTVFINNQATGGSGGGALFNVASGLHPVVEITASTFEDNTAASVGGAVFARETDNLLLESNRFLANESSGWGGALRISNGATTTAQHNLFCNNTSSTQGGAVHSTGNSGTQIWRNNVIANNTASTTGGFRAVDQGLIALNNTFVANTGGGFYYDGLTHPLDFRNNAVTHTPSGDGVVVEAATSAVVSYNLFYSNTSDDTSGLGIATASMTGNVFADPEYTGYPGIDACAPGALHPDWGSNPTSPSSPLIRAGDPSVSNPDGTRSDIGAFGGPQADPALWVDADGDGSPAIYDCDDNDTNNWVSCGSCVDADNDGWYVGCDRYETIDGPDCDDGNPNVWASCGSCVDADGDGWYVGCDAYTTVDGPDCDDDNPNVWESCATCVDNDGDGWWVGCDAYVTIDGPDCDDDDPNNWVSCDTCVDNDGDGWYVGCDAYETIDGPDCDDTNDDVQTEETWYLDCDGDGVFGSTGIVSCNAPTFATFDTALNPGVTWPCDGGADPVSATRDLNPSTYEFDCNDNNPNVWVSCDTCKDEDGDGWWAGCDAYVTIDGPDCDDTNADVQTEEIWWVDCDGDGWFGETEILSCNAPTLANFDAELNPGVPWPCYVDGTPVNPVGTATRDLDPGSYTFDCDDNDIYTWPGAPELCNGKDNNCSGTADDAVVYLDWYPDEDGDGFGDMFGTPTNHCDVVPGHVLDNTDCDDTDPTVYPGAPEICNGIDNNCNGIPDEPPPEDAPLWWPDLDGDGFGDMNADPELSCEQPHDGWVDNGEDCDDTDPDVYPGAPEFCNGIDNSCNGIPDDPDPEDATAWWPDADGDGYGDADADPVMACDQPEGYVDNDLDCDDGDPNVFPGAPEAENDCDRMDLPGPDDPGARFTFSGAGCTCDSRADAPALPALLGLGLVGLAALRRRERAA